ncbi:MAG: anaerobic ribonucleoside-triphosphate reductase activating protein [Aquificae bacterium]|nr:anaerobic ribonucleoside-triphosphate reductase activating protein [Aquificota bacterium]
MKIAGIQKFSMIDYPGKMSAVVFVQGCNFRCPYCHNRELVLPAYFQKTMEEEEVFNFLAERKGKLQGVVITGGEPTIFPDLPDFLKRIKKMGFYTKLDTNGSNPEMLKTLIERKLVDFVAMDVKAPIEKYSQIAGVEVDREKIIKSIKLIIQSGIEHEFRTTLVKGILQYSDLLKIVNLIKGAKRYAIQNFHPAETLVDEKYKSKTGYPKDKLNKFGKRLKDRFASVVVRD